MKSNRYHLTFANPFIINGVTWIIVWLLYNLGWSRLCPKLSNGLVLFILSTSIISIIIGILTLKRNKILFSPAKNINTKSMTIWLVILYILLLIEFAAAGSIPLLGYASGNVTVTYKDFGLPFINVIVVNGFSALCLYSFYCFKSSSSKKIRKKTFLITLLSIFSFILIFNRGGILSNLLGIFIISLVISKKPFILLLKIILGLFCILFVFGIAGNMRFGKSGMDKFTQLAQPTKTFTETKIPNEFLWSYLYIASPLANTQNTIDKSNYGKCDSEDLQNMVFFEMAPQIISKRLIGEDEEVNFGNRARLVNNSFTVASLYGRAYNYLGWTGLWLLFIFLLIFITVNINIIRKNSNFYFPMIVSVDIIVVLNLFDNMLTFMGLVPQVFIFLLLYIFSEFRFGNIRKRLA
ncbi:MAG: hypothetical protein K2O56_00830 [Muribaculaceae bacterium]|nr:hypothetical protein [Muribaculaceae bacterium]